jgi:hypothetical protein
VADIMMGSSATSDVADLSYFISHVVSSYQTVLRAGIFDIHGVLSTNVDRKKKGRFAPCPALVLYYILSYFVLFSSVLFCSALSLLVPCCIMLYGLYCVVSAFYCSILYAILRNAPL